ncbi:nitrate/nitrite transporter [Planctomycetota bacterium]
MPKTEYAHRWKILAFCYLIVLTIGATYMGFPALFESLNQDFNLTKTQQGLLINVFTLLGIVISIPVGIYAGRFGFRKICILGFSLFIIGYILCAVAGSYEQLLAGRLLCGGGSSLLSIIVPQVIAQWFRGREIGMAMGILNTSFPLGVTIGYQAFPRLSAAFSWHVTQWLLLGMLLLSAVAFFAWYRPAPAADKEKPERSLPGWRDNFKVLDRIWLLSLVWVLFNAGILSYSTYAAGYFHAIGHSLVSANFLAGLVFTVSIFCSPVAGWMLDRFKITTRIIISGCLGLSVLMALIPHLAGWELILSVGIGLVVAAVPPAVFSLPVAWIENRHLALAYGIINSIFCLGASIAPGLVGNIWDRQQSYPLIFLIMGGFCLLGGLAAFGLLRQKDTQASPVRASA